MEEGDLRSPLILLRGRLYRGIHPGRLCVSGIRFPSGTFTAMSSVVRTRISVESSVFFSCPVPSTTMFFHVVKLRLKSRSFVNQVLDRLQVKIVESGQTMDLVCHWIKIDEQFGKGF